jgi:hypothetical protein
VNSLSILFGRTTITIETGRGTPAELVDFLFGAFSPASPDESQATLRLAQDDQGRELLLWLDDHFLHKNADPGSMANFLLNQVSRSLAIPSRSGLMFHAAGVGLGSRGLMMPGVSGAGKSTLTAWLIAHGCDYMTDEMAFIAAGSDVFSGFPRPLSIKAPARPLLLELLGGSWPDSGLMKGAAADLIQAEQLGAQVVRQALPLSLVLFPHYRPDRVPGSDIGLHLLSKAEAAYELMGCLANGRNLHDHGLFETIRLAQLAPAYRLVLADQHTAGPLILDLIASS